MTSWDVYRNDASWSVPLCPMGRRLKPPLGGRTAAEAAQSSPVHRLAFRRAAASAAVIAIALTPSYLRAQCPDGSLPPCAGDRRPAPPDPDRIAILPFHVTSSDTLLGEGLAELIATAFGGESGPRAVHMGTVLRAWRRAGGDLRTPLSQVQARRLAQEIDAGRFVEGAVVGLGTRLTLSAAVIVTADGTARRVGPVSGPVDSLESLVGRLAVGLLGATGVERPDLQARLTDSPAAMRSYLDGLSFYRRSQFVPAAGAFERALALDPSFVRAALMRFVTAGWEGDPEPWARLVWAGRARLSAADRTLLTAFLGDRYPDPRSPESNLADRRAAVSQLPESPEAHYALGDYLYHSAGANNVVDAMAQARDEFERSLALDTQATVLGHLLDLGLYFADTARLRRYWPAYDRAQGSGPDATAYGIVIAERTGDSALAAAMERRTARIDYDRLQVASQAAGVSVDSLAQRYDRLVPAADEAERAERDWTRAYSLLALGRPSAVRAMRDRTRDPNVTVNLDLVLLFSALFGGGDSAEAARAAARLGSVTRADSADQAGAICARVLWEVHAGGAPRYDPAFLVRHRWRLCAASLDLLLAWRATAPDLDAKLATTDSLLRWDIANISVESHEFEHLILVRLWESRGHLDRAVSAVRLHLNGVGISGWSQAINAREEGRLAALVGDTTGAVRAYRRYLDFRRDPEPALIPQRDSVRAELARLEGRR